MGSARPWPGTSVIFALTGKGTSYSADRAEAYSIPANTSAIPQKSVWEVKGSAWKLICPSPTSRSSSFRFSGSQPCITRSGQAGMVHTYRSFPMSAVPLQVSMTSDSISPEYWAMISLASRVNPISKCVLNTIMIFIAHFRIHKIYHHEGGGFAPPRYMAGVLRSLRTGTHIGAQ